MTKPSPVRWRFKCIAMHLPADNGYEINVGLADEYRLSAPAPPKPVAEYPLDRWDCTAVGLIYVVDGNGRIVGVVGE